MNDRGIALVVAHKPDIRSQAIEELEPEGYTVHIEGSASPALGFLTERVPSLVIIAHPLGEESGIVLYGEVKNLLRARGRSALPVVVYVSAEHQSDVISALESGLDDFIRYPANPGALRSRVRLMKDDARESLTRGRVHYGPIAIDLGRHQVFCGTREVHLSVMELFILTILLRDPGRVWSRHDILRETHGDQALTTPRSVDVHIRALRGKLGEFGDIIETVRGVGYRAAGASAFASLD